MIETEIFEKFDNLSEDELNTKSNKNVYVKNDVMTTVIKRCKCERKIDGFRKNLMIPGSEISECPEHEVKPKIGNIFMNEEIRKKEGNESDSSKIKPFKSGKKVGATYCLGCKDYTHNFKPQEIK